MSRYATTKSEVDALLRMSSGSEEGKVRKQNIFLKFSRLTFSCQSEYNEWIVKDHRSIVEVLEDMPSVRPPIDHLLELLPRLQARYFSISSSPKVIHPHVLIRLWL